MRRFETNIQLDNCKNKSRVLLIEKKTIMYISKQIRLSADCLESNARHCTNTKLYLFCYVINSDVNNSVMKMLRIL